MRAIAILPAAVLAACFSGCVVAPASPGYDGAGAAVYVTPTYASPGPGYVWERHPEHGWGWHHPDRGWDKGWH